MTGLTHVYSAQSLEDAAIFRNHVEVAVFALFDAEFFPPRAPRFFGVLLGSATPDEICARMDFSLGAAGDGMGAAGLAGMIASDALIPAAFLAGPAAAGAGRGVAGAADTGRGVAGALAAAAGRAAGTATLGVVLLTTAATCTTAVCEEDVAEEEEDLVDDTEEEEEDEEETEDEVEEPDSEVVSAICTV
jgi:hypothetical protein